MRRSMLPGLLVCCSALTAPPLPPRQTAVQREVIQRVQRAAPADSAAATAGVLAFLDDDAFRAGLKRCCPAVATLSAPELYSRFKAEIATMELVHNFDPRNNGSPMDELNLTVWQHAHYDYNLWQMSVLGLRHASFLWNCDLAEVGLFGFPPFQGVREGSGDLPRTFAEASDRPTYTALNLWRNSVGNPKFGPVSVVFSPTYTNNLTFVLPVDSGLWESSCNRTLRHARLRSNTGATGGYPGRMNCSAWNRTDASPLLGTLKSYDHIAATWLSNGGIWQPSYSSLIPARWFDRLFGTGPPLELTMEEGSTGQLYWEARERTCTCSSLFVFAPIVFRILTPSPCAQRSPGISCFLKASRCSWVNSTSSLAQRPAGSSSPLPSETGGC